MRTFDHFPQDMTTCPLCDTNDDKPCFLMQINGTQEGNICQGQPVHVDCWMEAGESAIITQDRTLIGVRVKDEIKEP